MQFTYIGNQSKKDVRLAGSFANGAFVTANSAASFANGAYLKANASYIAQNTTASFANGAFDKANSAGSFSNGAFLTANSGASFANGAFAHANAAFAAANTSSMDSWARGTANAAFLTANLAYNVVFNSSNTAALYYITRNFTGDGTTNTFTISSNTSANSILVFDNGITQNPLADYSVTGNTITFVDAPANGSIIQVRELLSNVPIITDNSNSAFDRANSAYSHANAAYTQANTGAPDSWARTQSNSAYDTANSGSSFANSAYAHANAAYNAANTSSTDSYARNTANAAFITANSSYDSQNTTASFAKGAFAHAKAAYNSANNATDTWVRNQANNAYNTANSAGSFANGAFSQANSASSFANGAFVTANAGASFANAAFDRANSGYGVANTGSSFANGAFSVANSAASFANGSFITANAAASFANGAFLRANSGYGVANSGASFANGAFIQANTGVTIAGSAFDHANAAYNAANTGSGSSSGIAVTTDNFTANGSTTTFNLSVTPSSEDFVTAVVDGTVQYRNSYTVANGVITFDTTFESGALIEVTSVLQGANVTVAAAKKYFTFIQTGSISTPVTGTARSYPTANCTISNVYASLGTAATDTFTFVLKKNGTTVGTYNMSSGTYRMGATAASISLTDSDYLTINITAGTGATDLKVDLEYS